jgi:hypothetical protein
MWLTSSLSRPGIYTRQRASVREGSNRLKALELGEIFEPWVALPKLILALGLTYRDYS